MNIDSSDISKILFDQENCGSYDMKLKALYSIFQSDPLILNNHYKILLLISFGDALINDERFYLFIILLVILDYYLFIFYF